MPTYLYKCETCGREIEEEHGINDDPHTEIPHISGIAPTQEHPCLKCTGPMKRLIAGKTSFSLKGTGWTAKSYV